MRGHRGAPGLAVAVALSLVGSLPLLTGQGCPGDNNVIPISPELGGELESGVGGNVAPTFAFTAPMGPVQAEIGDPVYVSWACTDPDDNASITLLLDPDSNPANGNEIPIAVGLREDDQNTTYVIDTGSYGLNPGSYGIVARVTDGVNPEQLVAATGRLNLLAPGMGTGNVSPTIVVTSPVTTLSVSDGSQVTITYCGNDVDDGEGGIIPDVLVMLDNDNDPLNDLFAQYDHRTPEAATAIAEMCAGDLPLDVGGAVLLECGKDDNCTDPANGTDLDVVIDATRIPQPPGNEPYRVRVSMWDHTNPPVHGYAQGTLSIAALASGAVDLGDVGRSITGSRFIGFDTGGRAGFTGTSLGDFDGDGADDLVIVARWGRPFERGNVGSAYLVYGTPGQRFGSDIFLNSYGLEYRGCMFASGHAGRDYQFAYYYTGVDAPPITEGITAVTSIEDLTGDGRPEILFGVPYAEGWWDYHDDDPCDSDGGCYGDGLPNPLSTDGGNDDLGAWDRREGPIFNDDDELLYLCSNDEDLSVATPLDQGYIVYVSSENPMEDTVIDITMTGQKDPASVVLEEGTLVAGSSVPTGARFRGSYYSYTLSDVGFSLEPFNDFGRTLGTLPDLGTSGALPVRDGQSELLISLPNSYEQRGSIELTWGQDYGSFCAQEVQSIPDYRGGGTPCFRGLYVPSGVAILGAKPGDEFGYANRAGDINRDGHQDILCGAPGAAHLGASEAGTVYVIYGRLDFGHADLASATDPDDPMRQYIPRVEIRGTAQSDRFGEFQSAMGDVNNDGFDDIAFASQWADGPGGMDAGMVGIVFGNRSLTGEQVFYVNEVGTPKLKGCVFYGSQRGGHAGTSIANIGDFNGDGFNDLLITAPREIRVVNGQNRRGVAYLVFGGPHLANNPVRNFFMFDQVGTDELPGIVFVSPYTQGTADEATVDWAGAAGDVDGDGFSDILIGVSEADFVNPQDPGQRRVDAGEAYLIYGNNSGGNIVRH